MLCESTPQEQAERAGGLQAGEQNAPGAFQYLWGGKESWERTFCEDR